MQSQLLTEVPSSLKQLARLVVRGFYEIEFSLIVDMLVRYHCMREDDLCELLKFDKKVIRMKLATLKADKFLMAKMKIETDKDGKAVKMNCWFINYRIFVNIVKYKLDHMRKKMETEERDATGRSSFKCCNCDKQFTDLEVDQIIDPMNPDILKCTFCGSEVLEDESAMPRTDSRQMIAKFNDQMEKLYDLLRIVEDIKLAQEVLEPDPVDFVANEAGERKMVTDVGGQGPGGDNAGKWSGEATRAGGGFGTEDQKVTIKFGEEEAKVRETKEVPTWMTESTVNTDAASAPGPSVPGMGVVTVDDVDNGDEPAPDDEITNLLLRHERTNNKDKVVIPGDDSDSDKSDESDMEQADDTDAALLAAMSANNDANDDDDDDEVQVMEDDSDDNDDIPTINVGGEEYDLPDVNPDIIAKMTPEEMDKYNQMYAAYYKDMYD